MRYVEAFIGEYASGKSENAINRALDLQKQGREVTLVDLDTVEPFYTLRPIKRKLEEQGLSVVAWETHETMGLGEAGSVLKPEMRWVLRRSGDIILDVGYGVHGAKIFNLIEGALEDKELKIYVVINTSRPMTSQPERIVSYIESLGKVDGIVHNTHLGAMTDLETIIEGKEKVEEAASKLDLPIIATAIEKSMLSEAKTLDWGHELWPIERYMEESMW
ncbi:hypothetical protein [Natranaerobius thermophilus]|uniref:ATP/GTP-binding protein n=1 Tax=Natranaerobius thermophilus (strain ATCC BAA-1301 / DSM 18059 / JW/NM-WN-LF) TaxID=457570 RepID=B2A305_NATTJ|nr:hypothetical protein [Natranaerobius thermophilus]ACB83619.1 conserved hypothetical protein [Natranaerobius thermophilus JW/NM-WN-LF]